MEKKYILLFIILLGGAILLFTQKKALTPDPQRGSQQNAPIQDQSRLAEPIKDFKTRVTKKPFGIYVTPKESPVQPERFTGYHTGADVEYQDVSAEVPVFAVNDGRIVLSQSASGYGGVFIMEFQWNSQPYTALYGHIKPDSMPKVGTEVKKGDKIGILGNGFSSETDGERKHLHFGILKGSSRNLLGYVEKESDLTPWINPIGYF